MKHASVLVTGFEAYGGLSQNPAHDVMQRLDGQVLDGHTIVGCSLPVSISELNETVGDLLMEHRPAAVLSLGLAPGEPAIRIERVGLNLADFPIPDNAGDRLRDESLNHAGPAARWTSAPARPIERALLAAGIPARLSVSAGTYLCNACIYTFMEMLEEAGESVPYCFLHVPLTPPIVARTLLLAEDDIAPRPSMDIETILEASQIALREMLAAAGVAA